MLRKSVSGTFEIWRIRSRNVGPLVEAQISGPVLVKISAHADVGPRSPCLTQIVLSGR